MPAPQSGEDVTGLMNDELQSGQDVTDLMSGQDVTSLMNQSAGHWETKGLTTQWMADTPTNLEARPDRKVFDLGSFGTGLENRLDQTVEGMANYTPFPDAAKKYYGLGAGMLKMLASGFEEPDVLATMGAGLFKPKASGARIPEVLPPEAPQIRGALPAHENPFIVGEQARTQRADLINPQEEARLAGYDVGNDVVHPLSTGNRTQAPTLDIAELRERERIANLNYTSFEHEGGVPLNLPNASHMESPPVSGDTGLGFKPQSDSNLPYPLNVVPNSVRPRSAQNVTRALAGDDFAREIKPSEPVEFVSPPAEKSIAPHVEKNLQGGTAAIEPYEKAIIHPSAVPRPIRRAVKVNTGLDVGAVKPPANVPPAIAESVKQGVKEFSEAAGKPSFLLKSIYKQLEELGPSGKDLVQRFQRAAQNRSEFDAAWTEPLFKVASKLSRTEFDNFGAYVEGRMPIPNQKVQAAVDEWSRVQNMRGDTAVAEGLHLKRGDQVIPFEKQSGDYWPHFPQEQLTKKSIIDRLVDNGMSRSDAINVAKKWDATGEILIGPQHSRMKEVFPYRDDLDVAIQHGRTMSKRIANHKNLGPKDVAGWGDEGIAGLIEDANDPALAVKLAKRLAGRDERPSEELMNGLNHTRKAAALTSLPNFTTKNVILGQQQNAFMMLSSRHPIKATREIFNLFKSGYQDEIRAAGVFNSFNSTLMEELGRWKKFDPFFIGAGEKLNRSVSAAIGRSIAKTAFEDYKAGVNVGQARDLLERLLSRDPDTIQAITPELERFAAGRMAELNQGLGNPGNLPYHWSNPVNGYDQVAFQLALIFKKTGFQISKSVWDTIKADPKVALPAWIVTTQAAGEMIGDVSSILTGRDRPEDLAKRIADNWGNAFIFGLAWDLAASGQYGPSGLLNAAAGPAYGKTSELGYNAIRTGKNLMEDKEDPFSPLKRQGIKNLPVPGRERLLEKR